MKAVRELEHFVLEALEFGPPEGIQKVDRLIWDSIPL